MPGLTGLSSIQPIPFGGGGRGGAGCVYLILAPFSAPNQAYANGQVLDTPAEGVDVGRLTVVELDGTIQLLNDRCRLGGKTVTAFNDLGFYSTDIVTRALSRTLFASAEVNNLTASFALGWNDAQDVSDPAAWEYAIQFLTAGQLYQSSDTSGDDTVGTHVQNQEYTFCLSLGGYDASGQPWYVGAAGGPFTRGCFLWVKGGGFADWNLLWRWPLGTAANLYPAITLQRMGIVAQLRDFCVIDHDYTPAFQPVLADWFTDPNGTSLHLHTPDVGGVGGYTEHVGNFDIQANRANMVGSVARSSASIESGLADFWGRITVNPQDGASTSSARDHGFIFRYSDPDNYWWVGVNNTANAFRIVERNAAVETVRATAATPINVGQAYEISIACDGTEMQAWLDGANRITRTAAFNQNATRVGLRGMRAGGWWNNLHIHRIEGSQYDILEHCI